MHGFGIHFWQDGRSYIGYFANDKKHGYGTYFWVDSRRYEGWWFKGK
jgi:hypothetical protein